MLQSLLNFLSAIAFFIASAFGVNMSTEQQRYEVMERIGKNIEIRQYPTRIVAETTIDARISGNPRGDAFRIVAAYIFGANKAPQKIDMTAPVEIAKPSVTIPMTAPVEVNTPNNVLIMRFFMPSSYSINNLPDPPTYSCRSSKTMANSDRLSCASTASLPSMTLSSILQIDSLISLFRQFFCLQLYGSMLRHYKQDCVR